MRSWLRGCRCGVVEHAQHSTQQACDSGHAAACEACSGMRAGREPHARAGGWLACALEPGPVNPWLRHERQQVLVQRRVALHRRAGGGSQGSRVGASGWFSSSEHGGAGRCAGTNAPDVCGPGCRRYGKGGQLRALASYNYRRLLHARCRRAARYHIARTARMHQSGMTPAARNCRRSLEDVPVAHRADQVLQRRRLVVSALVLLRATPICGRLAGRCPPGSQAPRRHASLRGDDVAPGKRGHTAGVW